MKIKELIQALNKFNDEDIVVLSTCDENGDEIDLFNFYIDSISDCSYENGDTNNKFTEVRICQLPHHNRTQHQVLVYDNNDSILSSQHFDEEPSDNTINAIIKEDNGIRAELYLVEYPSEKSNLIAEFN